MAEMKGIKLCGECGNYDWKKHKCKIGCNDDCALLSSFYGDCPLPDVVPKSEVVTEERCREIANEMIPTFIRQAKQEVEREIFEEIENKLHDMAVEYYDAGHPEYFAVCEVIHHKVVRPVEKKYTESEDKG